MKRAAYLVVLFVAAAGALDLMKQRGWIGGQPMWLLSGLAAALGVILGRWLRDASHRIPFNQRRIVCFQFNDLAPRVRRRLSFGVSLVQRFVQGVLMGYGHSSW